VGLSAAAHVVLALVIAAVPRAPDQQSPPVALRPAEHVAYMEVSAWPAADAIRAADGAKVASTPAAAPNASAIGTAHPAAEANRPAVTADSGAVGDVTPTVDGVETAPPTVAAGPGGRTTAARLSPEYGDPRLVAPPPSSRAALGNAARFETEFRARWRGFRDSIQHEMDRERLAASWTWKDPTGRAWGVRDGELFINGQRIMAMETYGERDQDRATRMRTTARREIARQAEDIERDRHLQERGRAIRTRSNHERAGARP
jgi:hypothetical protein